MKCPKCNQQPMSQARFVFTLSGSNIKCSHCGAWLKGGKLTCRILYGFFILCFPIGLGFAYFNDIYELGLNISNMIILAVIISVLPLALILWRYGVYEEQLPYVEFDKKDLIAKPGIKRAIIFFGVIVLSEGIVTLYFFFHSLAYKFAALSGYGLMKELLSLYLLIGVGFIISGYGILKIKPWARYSLFNCVVIFLSILTKDIVSLGISTMEFYYLGHFAVFGLLIWFFNLKQMRTIFLYHKDKELKNGAILFSTIILLGILAAGIFWFNIEGYRIPKLRKGIYNPKDKSFFSEDYLRTSFPLKFTMVIPKDFFLRSVSNKNGIIRISLLNCDKGFFILSNNTYIQGMLQWFSPQKFFSERFGLIFAMLRTPIYPVDTNQLEEVQMNDIDAFIMKSNGKFFWRDYHLFRQNECLGSGTISVNKEGEFNKILIDKIISSIEYQEKPLKSALEFFQEGVTLYNRQDYEKAKLSFASALCLDWDNSQYHYYLGACFFQDENWKSAKDHIEQAISLQPDYLEAKTLLEKIESKKKGI